MKQKSRLYKLCSEHLAFHVALIEMWTTSLFRNCADETKSHTWQYCCNASTVHLMWQSYRSLCQDNRFDIKYFACDFKCVTGAFLRSGHKNSCGLNTSHWWSSFSPSLYLGVYPTSLIHKNVGSNKLARVTSTCKL